MDVSCPRCRTEYELDDTRVPSDGVTVKCTQCSHVFRVKRKEMVLTLPARPEDAANAQAASELPPPPPSREWKVRLPAGSLFACRELTTLQKWIVEGKVGRDAEISLSGDTWKRLGDIPELASFFQVVDEAQKGRALDALRQVSPAPNLAPELLGASPPPSGDQPRITDTWKEPKFATNFPQAQAQPPRAPESAPPVPAPPPQPQAPPEQPPPPPPPSVPPKREPNPVRKETIREAAFSTPPPAAHVPHARAWAALENDDDDLNLVRPSRRGVWFVLILLGLGIGGGLGYYFGFHLPEQQRLEREQKDAADRKAAEAEAAQRKADADARAKEQAELERKAREAELDASVHDAGLDAGAGAADAGPPDAGKAAAEPVRTYDWYVAQGDRLRDREKPDQALNMYGRAADLRPDSVEPIAGRGLALLDLGQSLAAEASFEQALKLNPRYGPAIMGMAESFRVQGKNEKAVEWYQKYLDVLPTGAEADVARNNIERLKK